MELHYHIANHYGSPIVRLKFVDGRYEYTAGADLDEYCNAEPRMVDRDEAPALWPDANGAEVVTAITEARTPISLQEFITQLEAL